jgi:hypothetical protein
MDIYLVIHETHNADTEVTPFVLDLDAFRFASQQVQYSFAGSGTIPDPREFEMELTQVMAAAGWIWYCRYHPEGDSVRVVKRELRSVGTVPAILSSRSVPSRERTAELAETLANAANLAGTPVFGDIRQAARSTWMAARGWTGENG